MNNILIRPARIGDAAGMSEVINGLQEAGLRKSGGDAAFALSFYVAHADRVLCQVALDGAGKILGFQSLKRATLQNPYGTPQGWGIIGTHIALRAGRKGIGRAFFAGTRRAASQNGLRAIEAGIGVANVGALGYYDAMEFRTYKEEPGIIYKAYRF